MNIRQRITDALVRHFKLEDSADAWGEVDVVCSVVGEWLREAALQRRLVHLRDPGAALLSDLVDEIDPPKDGRKPTVG